MIGSGYIDTIEASCHFGESMIEFGSTFDHLALR
jgi:hypothetical protein